MGSGILAFAAVLSGFQSATPDVRGKLLYSDGRIAAGAKVFLVDSSFQASPKLVAETQSAADGTFSFTGIRPPRPYFNRAVVVRAPGAGLVAKSTWELPNMEFLVLPPPTSVRVVVRDREFQPIGGVKVGVDRLGVNSVTRLPSKLAEQYASVTDRQGWVTIPGLGQGETVILGPRDGRYESPMGNYLSLGWKSQNTAAPISLIRAGRLSGQIRGTGPTGEVKLIRAGIGKPYTTTVDAQGRFDFESILPGRYNLVPGGSEGSSPVFFAPVAGIVVNPGEHKTLDKALPRLPIGYAEGSVTQIRSNAPLARVAIQVILSNQMEGTPAMMVMSDAEGKWRLPLPVGKHRISLGFDGDQDIVIKRGQTVRRDLVLPQWVEPSTVQPPLTVSVVDAEGKPVPYAQVCEEVINGFTSDIIFTTNSEGTVSIPNSRPPMVFRARHAGKGTSSSTTVVTEKELILRLSEVPMGTLRGRVVDSKGKPVPHLPLHLFEQSAGRGLGREIGVTDARGYYEFEGLWADRGYSVGSADPQWGGPLTATTSPKPGDAVKAPVLKVSRASQFVTGKVVDEKGKPMAGIDVGTDFGMALALSDANGNFKIGPVAREISMVSAFYNENDFRTSVGRGKTVLTIDTKRAAPNYAAMQPTVSPWVGKDAPEFVKVEALDGAPHSLAELRGKIVVLDFWGITCGPCLGELPGVERLWKSYQDRGVAVIGVHHSDTPTADIEKMVRAKGLTYPTVVDSSNPGVSFGKTFSAWSVNAIPSMMVIGRDGKIAAYGVRVDDAFRIVGEILAKEAQK